MWRTCRRWWKAPSDERRNGVERTSGNSGKPYPARPQAASKVRQMYTVLSKNFSASKLGKYLGNNFGYWLTCRLLKF